MPQSHPRRPGARRGQALLGALVAVGVVALLVAGLYNLAIEGSQAGQASLAQIAMMGIAEAGLNVTAKMVIDTANQSLVQNLQQVPRSTAQSWGQSSTSYSAAQGNFQTMMTQYGPFAWYGAFPNSVQSAPQAAVVCAYGTQNGAGTSDDTWEACVGLIAIPSPLPSWQDNGVTATLTFPIGLLAHAWVWQGPPSGSPPGAYLGEVTSYSPTNLPGSIVITYQDCPAYYQPASCTLPTGVQVTVPPGQLLENDPNVSTPAAP